MAKNIQFSAYCDGTGLYGVDRQTFERTAKPSAAFYREIIENNGLNADLIAKYLKEMPSLRTPAIL